MKLPRIPFLKRKKAPSEPRRRPMNMSPDVSRIQRELAYEKKLNAPNTRLNRLSSRLNAQGRRSYGRRS